MEAPRPVPPYDPKIVQSAWWYCLHCRQAYPSDYSAKTHVRQAHFSDDRDFEPVKGEDYTNGDHLRVLIQRWASWSLQMIDRFSLQLESLRGADDLALEVGDGLPE